MHQNYLFIELNMPDSEFLKTFNERRHEFKPYGFTCELWTPGLMKRPDRHNEIEINYFPEDSITYFFQERKVTIPTKRLTVFWGLVPHQIVHYESVTPYFVCTIPFAQFLEWKLPSLFVDRILKGEVLIETSDEYSVYDEFLFNNWIGDIIKNNQADVTLLEIQARLARMAGRNLREKKKEFSLVHANEISPVEQIAVYIAQNYNHPIKVSEIGEAVGLHPDYANALFKKAFGSTLSEYVTEERISHAQRKLVTTGASITEIAFDCGFNSISRFNAAFRRINHCTPREFRKRNR